MLQAVPIMLVMAMAAARLTRGRGNELTVQATRMVSVPD